MSFSWPLSQPEQYQSDRTIVRKRFFSQQFSVITLKFVLSIVKASPSAVQSSVAGDIQEMYAEAGKIFFTCLPNVIT